MSASDSSYCVKCEDGIEHDSHDLRCRNCGTLDTWHDESDGQCPDDDAPHPNSPAALSVDDEIAARGIDVEPLEDTGADPDAWRDEPPADQDAPRFDWQNNRRVVETQVLSRESVDDVYPTDVPWNVVPLTASVDQFLDGFKDSPAYVIDRDDDHETADTVRAANLQGELVMIRVRERSVYPGLYDNVERLLDALKLNDNATIAEDIDREYVIDALAMILCHDQGERDRQAPEGYCRHGKYVGGCGVDWMCGACEDGSQ